MPALWPAHCGTTNQRRSTQRRRLARGYRNGCLIPKCNPWPPNKGFGCILVAVKLRKHLNRSAKYSLAEQGGKRQSHFTERGRWNDSYVKKFPRDARAGAVDFV